MCVWERCVHGREIRGCQVIMSRCADLKTAWEGHDERVPGDDVNEQSRCADLKTAWEGHDES